MCASNPPPGPNYQGLAQQQGNANLDAARVGSRLNNPSVYGPTGSQVVSWDGDQANIFQLLSPEQQALYDQGVGNASALGGMAQRGIQGMSGIGSEFNFSGMPGAPTAYGGGSGGDVLDPNGLPSRPNPFSRPGNLPGLGSGEDVRRRVIDAMMTRTNEDFSQRRDQANSDLVARGLRPGTEAYAREMDALEESRNDARQQAEIAGGNAAEQAFGMDSRRRSQFQGEALDNATLEYAQRMGLRSSALGEQAQRYGQQVGNSRLGMEQQGQGFDQQSQSRRNAIAEALMQRQIPMGEISQLLGLSRNANPFQMPGFNGGANVAPAPIYGAGQLQGNYDTDVYNANTASRNANMQAIASLLGGFDWSSFG
jgi:hypothetical protein